MKGSHFLSVQALTREQVVDLIELAKDLKAKQATGVPHATLSGKCLAMLFQKPSNRTRVSFEAGMYQLGGRTIVITQDEVKMGVRETIPDVSRVLSRYVDAIMIRPFYHSDIVEFAEFSRVPVINGLSDLYHPCQAVADLLTVAEAHRGFDGLKLCYIGDGNNVCNSLINICSLLGIEVVVSCPPGYEPTLSWEQAHYTVVHDPREAVGGSDVVYTDVWISMGPDEVTVNVGNDFLPYTVTADLMALAKPSAIFMHCLPAHRGEEVEADVLEGPQSVVFDQAENRMHAQKAILTRLLADS